MDDIILSALARGKPVSAARVRALVEENARLRKELDAAHARADAAERQLGEALAALDVAEDG